MSVTDRIASLTPEQRELFEKLREKQKKAARTHQPPPVRRVSGPAGEGDWPLSFDQERFWFVEQLYPGEAGLNIAAASRMRGALPVPVVSAALGEIARRHAAWRTTVPLVDGAPVQRVAAAGGPRLALIDLSALPAPQREAEVPRLVRADAATPFDLERGPLVRSSLLRLGAEDHVCLLTLHHLITDFVSFQIAWGELAALCAALLAGRPAALPEPPVQYPDFAVWQREWLRGEVLDGLVAWWRERLDGFPHQLDLPTDRPRPAILRVRGEQRPVKVPRELSDKVRALAWAEGVTVFMTVLAATAALVCRDSGQERILLGANSANRNRPEIEAVLGCFLTQVPFPIDLTGDPTFRELLARARQSALGVYTHQDLPFGKLVEALQPERDTSRPPLVQALVQVLDGQPAAATLAGLTFEAVDSYDGRARYELMLTLFDSPEGLAGSLEFNTDLFDGGTVERLLGRLQALLAGVVADPGQRLAALPLLSAAETGQILRAEVAPGVDLAPAAGVHELIAGRARLAPEAVAVICGEERLTYRQLDESAEALAYRLRGLGVGPEVPVALCLERSARLVVGMLGILKAGGVYVPLEPEDAAARLAFVLADSGAAALVTEAALARLLPASGAHRVLLFDEIPDESAPAAPLPRVLADNLAYVIYTSGSTGVPKGVAVTHAAAVAHALACARVYGIGEGDRVLQFNSVSFDPSLEQAFSALISGATLVVRGPGLWEPGELTSRLAELELTVANLPTAYWALWAAEAGAGAAPPGLRTVIAGGEEMRAGSVRRWLHSPLAGVTLLNAYGPTEAVVSATLHTVGLGNEAGPVPIGRPLPGRAVRVLGRGGSRQPVGVPGELALSGLLARGYLGRPGLTAERFVPDPFGGSGDRLYRTGDLARRRPDGELEFLGRLDDQVKIRGFRVEPGEVEAALLGHPAVRDAAVVAHPAAGGSNQLVAYVVPATGEAPPVEDLRGFLQKLLPEYMVPWTFVPLAELPLNVHGKVDRKALPAPAARGALAGSALPRNAREELLAGIWREVLGLERVGIDDNFFQLGGDSILSIQVVARARKAGLLLTIRQFFAHQTIAGLAAIAGSTEGMAAPGEDQGAVEGRAPLTPIQRRFFAEERREPWRFNQAVLLASSEWLATAPLVAALARVAEHHDAVRLRFPREAGERTQLHAPVLSNEPHELAPLLEIDLTALPPGERGRALEAAAERLQSGLDLVLGPVFTAALFRREGEEGDRLLLTAHHLVVDGVSWRVLLEDLTAAYRQLAAGAAPELPAKTTSWKRWAGLLAAHAGSPELLAELPYWLAPSTSVPPLPRDLEGESGRGTVSVELGPEETRALLQAVPEVYRTQVNDLLLAALARVFATWTGESALRVDLEGHGREEIFPGVDLSRTVGWFTTLFPVTLALPPGAGPREAIRTVKETLRAVPRRGLGYGLLRYLAASERLAALPAPEVSFNYLGRFGPVAGEEELFAFAPEAVRGVEGEPVTGRPLFAIDALVLDDRLRVTWTYDPGRHLPATAERLAHGFLAEIATLVVHCLSPEAGGFTPSDFPLAGLDQATLDGLLGNDPGNDRGVEDLYPLAPMQEGLLFHSLYTPGGDLYFEQLTAELEGPLDAPAFAAAWQRVVERHPALRTAFLWQGVERPLQLVRREAELPWMVEDWQGLPSATRESRWRDLLAADRARGFDLTRPPLMRLALVRTDPERHRLIWSTHHLLFDGWCFSLLLTEVFARYEAAVSRREALLPPSPRPYRDYIAWLAERDEAESERYWQQRLQGFTASTPVPFDHPAALHGSHGHRTDDYFERGASLPASRAGALEALAQRLQVTLNTLVQGAWALLLSQHAQVSDIVFGAVVSGRPAELPGVESMVGLFINSLPVRVEIPEDEPASSWLTRLQASQFEMRQHEWTPLARIQELSELSAGEPLFMSLLIFENYPVAPALSARLGGLRIKEAALEERTNYPLALTVVARGEISLRLTADRRFEPVTVLRLLGHLESLLNALAADPERPPGDLPLLAAAERHQLTIEWNDTAAAFPAAASIPELFAEQAARRPDALALLGPGLQDRLTYRELEERAEALAGELAELGIQRGDLVMLFAERSAGMVIAMLAILKAGAAYVPLDPAYPSERLALMLADIAVPLVLVQPDLAGRLPAGNVRTLQLGPAVFEPREGRARRGGSGATADDLAYVLFTSGSTGRPKGVAVSHRNVVRLVRGSDFADMGADQVWLQYAPVSFDLATLEIWAPLLNGGRLALFPGGIGSLDDLSRFIARHGVTSAWLTAGLFHEMVDGCLEGLRPLRQLLAGGDVVSPEHARRTLEALPGLTLIDGYGPTECTTFTCCYRMTDPRQVGASVPIGRPISNDRAYVLDSSLRPVPVGVWGELYAGGAGVAHGYLDRPDLTAERFVPDLFAGPGESGGRLYRTGDGVRWSAAGILEFQGRLDAQIKIRGFRVEPAEVETALLAAPGVLRAAVVGVGPAGGKTLTAFWVGEAKAEELRRYLRDRLPEAMMPAAFVPLPDLPLTPNGKVNRRVLSAMAAADAAAPRPAAERVPPRTPMEENLVAAWAAVLGRDPGEIGVLDNFFELGGHSLLATRLVSLLQARWGIEVPLRLLFDTQDLAGLADRIVERELAEADDDLLASLIAEMGEGGAP